MRTHPMPLMLLAFIIVACDSFGPNDVALSLTTDKASYQLAEEAILVTVVNESAAPVYVGACLWPERRVGDGWVALAESELPDYTCQLVLYEVRSGTSTTIASILPALPSGTYRLRLYDVQLELDGDELVSGEFVTNPFFAEPAPGVPPG